VAADVNGHLDRVATPKGGSWLNIELPATVNFRLEPGDVVRFELGGGYRDPRQRSPELVACDVADGRVTPAQAAGVYGYAAPPAAAPSTRVTAT
jgi:N-methylhydantoinase B